MLVYQRVNLMFDLKTMVSAVDGPLNPSIDGLNVRLMVSMISDFGENEASSAVPPFQNGHFTSK